ncbi:hypothetical protein [Tunicatimonas pelagia]|uniref:hypothetical protein n=1 Tax=Tunicatimonas pelagia TaxID=931531 RepID=UPI00266568F3|nr:hypothetical protein [Tunicatimonas pelagia]WKN41296.1 hypothetical protein P0M28_19870 [Tunicatimonas pelagia]
MYLTKRLFYILTLISFTVLISCQDDEEAVPEGDIVGSWRQVDGEFTFNDLSIREYYRDLAQRAGLTLSEDELDVLEAQAEQDLNVNFDDGTIYEFGADGSFASNGPSSIGQGTWTTNGDQLVLTDGTNSTSRTITNLSNSELRLLFEDNRTIDLSRIGLSSTEPVKIGIILTFNKQ